MHDPYGGFEYAAWEARREMMEEVRRSRLARRLRPRRDLRGRVAPALRLVSGLWRAARPRVVAEEETIQVPAGEVPHLVYLAGESGTAVEVYLGDRGCVVRKTDLATGASTDAFVADGVER